MFVPSFQARRRQAEWVTVSPPRRLACPASAMTAVVGVHIPSFKPQPRWYIGSCKAWGKCGDRGRSNNDVSLDPAGGIPGLD
jgi:hypothetical protein